MATILRTDAGLAASRRALVLGINGGALLSDSLLMMSLPRLVDVVTATSSAKYLFKYVVHKGEDHTGQEPPQCNTLLGDRSCMVMTVHGRAWPCTTVHDRA